MGKQMESLKNVVQQAVYKKLLVLAKSKVVACLPASDFPSENPRPQTRNFPYTNTIWRNPFGLPPDRTGGLAVRSPFRDFAHQKVLQNAKHFAKPPVRWH